MNAPMLIIRDLTASDLDAVSVLAQDLVQLHHRWDSARFFTTPDVAQGYHRFFRSQIGVEGVLLLTAEVDGQVAGYLYGTHEKERDWKRLLEPHGAIHDVLVAETFRQHGVAKALLTEAAHRFRQWGAHRVVLSSAAQNAEGQALFRKLGFRATMVEMTLEL